MWKVNLYKGHTKILVTLLIVLGLHGCAGIYSVVDFEVLEPATVSFPAHVGQLIVMNRSPISLYVFEEEDRKGIRQEHLVIIDTAISQNTFRGLLSVLQQSPIERFHTPYWISDRRSDTTSFQDLILTKREVADICNRYGADAIICLELYTMDIDQHSVHYSDAPSIVHTHYYEISNKLQWNIYLPESPKPFDTYVTVDTVFFTDIQDGYAQPIPSTLEMIQEAFYKSGIKYGRYLVPVWTQTSRMLYKGKEASLKKASKHTARGEWDLAYEIWEGLTTSADSTTVSKSYNNMAIFHELEDNLDSADHLLKLALEYDTLEVVRVYMEELDTRILNHNEVLEQVR